MVKTNDHGLKTEQWSRRIRLAGFVFALDINVINTAIQDFSPHMEHVSHQPILENDNIETHIGLAHQPGEVSSRSLYKIVHIGVRPSPVFT